MKTMGMLSGTDTIAQMFEYQAIVALLYRSLALASTCGSLSHLKKRCLTVRTLHARKRRNFSRELNARRKSRHPRNRERQLHLGAPRSPVTRGLGRNPHLLRRLGRSDLEDALPARTLRAAHQLQGRLSHRAHRRRRFRKVDDEP